MTEIYRNDTHQFVEGQLHAVVDLVSGKYEKIGGVVFAPLGQCIQRIEQSPNKYMLAITRTPCIKAYELTVNPTAT